MDRNSHTSRDWSIDVERQIDVLSDEFEDALQSGETPSLEEFLGRIAEPQRERLLCELLPLELDALEDTGEVVSEETYLKRLPLFKQGIREVFSERLPLVSLEQFIEAVSKTCLIPEETLRRFFDASAEDIAGNAVRLGRMLVQVGLLTDYQCHVLLEGGREPLVLGDYDILERIGRGGMGQVYKARHRRMERLVALKTLPNDVADDDSTLSRFHREVKAAARLSHPNIVTAHDAREDDGVHYLVMEFVDGDDLSKLVKQRGPLPPALAAECILQAARGLEYAHTQGVIHRDIKPSNLLVEGQGSRVKGQVAKTPSAPGPQPLTLKVLDMGLARLEQREEDPSASARDLTGSGAVMGTVDFMAPEQAENTKYADQRSDVYSLGMTLFYLLSGRAAYDGETVMQRLLAHREGEIPSVTATLKSLRGLSGAAVESSVPHWQGLDDVFRKMAAKKPEDRYQTMTAVISDLEPLTQVLDLDEDTLRLDWQDREESSDPDANSDRVTPGSTPSPQPAPQSSGTAVKSGGPAAIPDEDTFRTEAADHTEIITPSQKQVVLPPRDRRGFRRIGLAAAIVGILLAGIVYRIQTNYGDVVVEITDESVAAQLTAGGIEVSDKDDPTKRWTINFAPAGEESSQELPPGEYRAADLPGVELQITDSGGAEYTTSEFKLTRNGQVRIRVTAVPEEPRPQGSGLDDAPNFALDFDGEDDHAELPFAESLLTGPFTIEATISARGDGAPPILYSTDGPRPTERSPSGMGLSMYHDRRPNFGMAVTKDQSDLWVNCIPELQLTESAHVAGVYDGNELRLFVNGRLASTRPVEGDRIRSTSSFIIGRTFNGQIDELRISNTARYTEDFTPEERFEPDEHTLALYHFDEGEGDVLVDSSGNGHDGTIHDATWVRVDRDYTVDRHVAELLRSIGADGIAVISETGEFIWLGSDDALPEGPFTLHGIDLTGNRNVTAELMRAIAELPEFNSIRLDHTSISDEGLRFLAESTSLWQLGMSDVDITDSGLEHLAGLSNLRGLHFNGAPVTDAGLAHLRGLAGLEKLSIQNTLISDAGIAHLANLENLLSLSAYTTDISDASVPTLIELTNLEMLSIVGTNISEDGVARLREALPDCLIRSDYGTFGPYDTDREVAEWVLSIGGSVQVAIDVDEGDYDPLMTLRTLPDLPAERFAVRSIRLESNPNVTDADLARIGELSRIEEIHLYRTGISDAGIEHLLRAQSLRSVALGANQVTDAGVALLSRLPNLSELDLGQNREVTPACLEHIEPLDGLTLISLGGTQIHIADLVDLSIAGNFRQIIFQEAGNISDEELVHFARFPNLEILNLGGAAITDAGLAHLSAVHGLKVLLLPTNEMITDAGVPALEELKGLVSLQVERTGLTRDGVERLREVLPTCRIVSDFGTFGPAGIDYDKEREIAEWVWRLGGQVGIGQSRYLGPDEAGFSEPFHVLSMLLRENQDVPLGLIRAFAGASDPTLPLGVDLTFNEHLTPELIQAIAEIDGLTGVSLGTSSATDEHLRILSQCDTLYFLLVDHTAITDSGLEHLAGLPRFQKLDLRGTQISDAGLVHLGRIAEIGILNLRGTNISDAGIAHLAGVGGLTHLYVQETDITDVSVPVFIQLGTLENLAVDGTQITAEGVARLHEGLPNLRIVSDFGTFGPPEIDYAMEREVAEWILERGGTVSVRLEDRLLTVLQLDQLPEEAFTVQGLNLANATLTEQEALLEPLAQISSASVLFLDHPLVSDDSLRNLAGLISVDRLSLIRTAVSDSGLQHLLGLDNLGALRLAESRVTAAGLQLLTELEQLHEIDLDGSQLTAAGATHLSQFGNLQTLTLRGSTVTDECLEHLAQLNEFDGRLILRSMSEGNDLWSVNVSDVGMATIVRSVPGLTELVLDAGPRMTSAGLASLQELSGLHSLNVYRRDLSDADMAAIADLPALRELTLGKLQVTDRQLDQLASLLNLDLLRISEATGDTEEGIRRLHEALPNCRIESDFGTFGPDYARERAVAMWVINRGGTVTVFTDEMHAGIAAVDQLPVEPFKVANVFLNGIVDLTDDDLANLAGLSSLGGIGLQSTPITGEGLRHIADMTTIELLFLNVCDRFDESHLRHIDGLVQLKHLYLSRTPAGDGALLHAAGLPQLELVALGAETTQAGLESLQDCPGLGRLFIQGCERLPDELTLSPDWLPGLTFLHIELRHVTPGLVAQLALFPNLTDLYFDGVKEDKDEFDTVVLTPLTQLTRLGLAHFGQGITDEDLAHVASLVNLEELSVVNTAVTEAGVQTLHEALPNLRIETDFGTIGPEPQASDDESNK